MLGARMEQLCRKHGFAAWFVTSARGGVNVAEGFVELAELIAANDPTAADGMGVVQRGPAGLGRDVTATATNGSGVPGASGEAGSRRGGGLAASEAAGSGAGARAIPVIESHAPPAPPPLPLAAPGLPVHPTTPPPSMRVGSGAAALPDRGGHDLAPREPPAGMASGARHLLLPVPKGWEASALPTAPASIATKAKAARMMSSVSHVSTEAKRAMNALVQVWDLDDME